MEDTPEEIPEEIPEETAEEVAAREEEAKKLALATTAAVILAAGEGTRFSGDGHKLLAKVQKKSVIEWAVRHALAAGFAETIVVSGAVDLSDVVPAEATLLMNHDWADGQSRSLQVAVTYAGMMGHEAVVVGLGDQPMVPPSAWQAVACSKSPIATAEFGGVKSPPVRLHADVWPLLPIEGDEGARSLIRGRSELVEAIPCEGKAADVDTLTDLDRVRSLANVYEAQAEGLGSWI